MQTSEIISTNQQVEKLVTKTSDYENATIWYKFSQLAITTGSVNLGQGFPDWHPPQFLIDSLVKHITNATGNHQYQRTMGAPKLVEAIAKNYSPRFKRELNPMTEILVGNGAVSLLYNIITAFINPGDEMIAIEGFYDCYLPQVLFSGGKVVGVPMIPPKIRDKSEYLNLSTSENITIKDRWQLDLLMNAPSYCF
jgi:aspartate/methionine/tyrosine aminotransferase